MDTNVHTIDSKCIVFQCICNKRAQLTTYSIVGTWRMSNILFKLIVKGELQLNGYLLDMRCMCCTLVAIFDYLK